MEDPANNHDSNKHKFHKVCVNTIRWRVAAFNYRTPAGKKNSTSCWKKERKRKEGRKEGGRKKGRQADRADQIKLFHTSLSKFITWEMFEMESHEFKSRNKPDYTGAISLQSGSQFQKKTSLEIKLGKTKQLALLHFHKSESCVSFTGWLGQNSLGPQKVNLGRWRF